MRTPLDVVFELPTWQLIVALLGLMIVAAEFGYRAGCRLRDESESSRTISTAIKASIVGLVAFLLSFSFAMTSGRHDLRRKIVLDEANAIGTCHLRAGLLADPQRSEIRDTLRKYVDARMEYFQKGLEQNEGQRISQEMNRLLGALWDAITEANQRDPDQIIASQIVPAGNAVIDLNTTREWANRNHVPTPVLVLLVVSILVSCGLIGHSSGQITKRQWGLWAAFIVLLALLLYVVLDFDRPRRGLVRVDHTPLIELQTNLEPESSPP